MVMLTSSHIIVISEFPQLVDKNVIGLVVAFVGVAEVLGGILSGFLSDRVGRSVALCVGGCIYGVGLMLAAIIKSGRYQHIMEPGIQGEISTCHRDLQCTCVLHTSFISSSYVSCM